MWSKDRRREYYKEYYRTRCKDNPEYKEKKRRYYEANRRRIALKNIGYRERNAERIKEYQTMYRLKKRLANADT